MLAYTAAADTVAARPPREISRGVKRLALSYIWLTVASSAIVFSEPALYDALMVGAIILLPLAGLAPVTRGLALYLLLLTVIIAGGLVATTQAGVLNVPASHVGITLYLALSSVVMAAFFSGRPIANIRLVMSAYMVSALIAAVAGLVGYFNLVPGANELFTEFGRARGTFKDPNVLGAFLVPALLYAFNEVMAARFVRAAPWALATPLLLFGTLLTFSRGAWINLAVSLAIYAYLTFATAGTNRQRLKLMVCVVLAGAFAIGLFAAAQNIPKVAALFGERASLEQTYDVGPEGRFGGQKKAAELILTHPLGIGALEFARVYHNEDVHQVYLNMFLNTGWVGGTMYLFLVLATMTLGLRGAMRDRGGNGIGTVLVAAFFGMALEGLVIDTDHWRHLYLIMAMIWGMALAAPGRDYADRFSGRH
ncbi:MAG: O-antigen ligase family protein [Methyloceanibacter sp.]|nr:O-antigen ligase family protein [Methyloceanibacter sp.]